MRGVTSLVFSFKYICIVFFFCFVGENEVVNRTATLYINNWFSAGLFFFLMLFYT